MSKRAAAWMGAVVVALMSSSAFAESAPRNSACAGQRDAGANQTFCFEPEAVAGTLVGATGQTVRPLRGVHSQSLLRIRAHFVPQMMKSVENL